MQLFYTNKIQEEMYLNFIESKHIIKVLRKQIGDTINLTDGTGHKYKAKIISSDLEKCKIKILNKEKKEKSHNYFLHVAISPLKNLNRFEWFLEKSTEIGIDEITPLICEKTEKKSIKIDRCKKIIISAMKQSLSYHLPKINDPIDFDKLVTQNFNENKYIAHCKEFDKINLYKIKCKKLLILIGPEGDFTQKEINLALKNNFQSISLSNNRLRTETAGIITTHTVKLNNYK